MRAEVAHFAGEPVHDVAVFGQEVDVWIRPVEPEIERRRRAGIGAVAAYARIGSGLSATATSSRFPMRSAIR